MIVTDKAWDRFCNYVTQIGPCWIWTGPKRNRKHGSFSVGGVTRYAHQVSYHRHYGDSGDQPTSSMVYHTCGNSLCVNPEHLTSGTPKDIAQQRTAKGRGLGQLNGQSKIKDSDIPVIRRMVRSGTTQRAVAARYGVSPSLISKIMVGRTWSHVR